MLLLLGRLLPRVAGWVPPPLLLVAAVLAALAAAAAAGVSWSQASSVSARSGSLGGDASASSPQVSVHLPQQQNTGNA
jgi:hypothetical protein